MKYDGILICSDMDVTFEPTEQNINSLKEFQAEGGKFSVATGRNIKYVKKHFEE
ncbi:MAG: HAD hydrolase family protein [Clostridia bacterium]|nr:HAD hydrolase family protein [Clostridia bacterium]